jgi:hypothetical protein
VSSCRAAARITAVGILGVVLLGGSARADGPTQSRALRDEPKGTPPFPEPEIKDGEPVPSPLDGRVLKAAKVYEMGGLIYRNEHQNTWSLGVFEVLLGQELRTHRYPFYLFSTQASSIRMYDDKSYGLAFFQDVGGGVALGPIEPEVHVGAHIIEFDVFHTNWDFSLFSPRVSAEVGARFGRMRIEAAVYSQYLWRWYGDSYYIRGASIGLQVDQPKMRVP